MLDLLTFCNKFVGAIALVPLKSSWQGTKTKKVVTPAKAGMTSGI
jgi:hypothetical protein